MVDRIHAGSSLTVNFVRRLFTLTLPNSSRVVSVSCVNHNLHYIYVYSNHIIEHLCLANPVLACRFLEFRRKSCVSRLFQTNDRKNDFRTVLNQLDPNVSSYAKCWPSHNSS